jgi:hypothetical protein
MKLIPNARSAWRMLSVRVAATAVAFGTLDPVSQAGILSMLHISPERLPAIMGLAIIVARLIDQPKTREG